MLTSHQVFFPLHVLLEESQMSTSQIWVCWINRVEICYLLESGQHVCYIYFAKTESSLKTCYEVWGISYKTEKLLTDLWIICVYINRNRRFLQGPSNINDFVVCLIL